MTMNEYVRKRGLRVSLVAQKMGVSRQAVSQYGNGYVPTTKVLERVAVAMTELGATTTVVDLVAALYEKENG